MTNNIILVGYMGCGKTTVGKNLAKIIKYRFIDTDEMIEQEQGRKISEIFAQDGEEYFRRLETELLKKMLSDKNNKMVISTGGGMPVREINRKLLSELGEVVFLKADAETIYNRIKHDTKRPLLQCEDPLSKIREMIVERTPAYNAAADVIMYVDNLRQYEVAERIRKSCRL